MPISSSQMLEINTRSQQEAFSGPWSPKARYVIVLLALYWASKSSKNNKKKFLLHIFKCVIFFIIK